MERDDEIDFRQMGWPTIRHYATGVLVGAFLVAQVALLEVYRFTTGGYDLLWRDYAVLIGAYGLSGLAVATVCAGLLVPLLAVGRRLGRLEVGGRLVTWLLASSSVCALTAVFLNKAFLPSVTSPGTIAANLALLALFGLLAVALSRGPRATRLALLLLALVAVVNVGVAFGLHLVASRGQERARPGERGPREGPLVVLVVIDTLRPDHLGAYGYDKDTSPVIDELSSEAIVFEAAYSPANWTRPAIASLFTSTLPTRHGVNDFHRALPASLETLAETFQENGFRTGVFSANPNVEAGVGYERGADVIVQFTPRGILNRSLLIDDFLRKDARSVEHVVRVIFGYSTTPRALTLRSIQWLEEQSGAAFAYLHYEGPHSPYAPPRKYLAALGGEGFDCSVTWPPKVWAGREAMSASARRRMIGQYDGEILWHDGEIGHLVEYLRKRARLQDVVLVLTSDHGEAFGENGVWAHEASFFDEVTRVPLLIWCSHGCGPARRIAEPVSLIDVAPTVLEMASVEMPESYVGSSLVPLLQGDEEWVGPPIVSVNPKSGEASIRTPIWALAYHPDGREWLWRRGQEPVVVADLDENLEGTRLRLRTALDEVIRKSEKTAVTSPTIELDERRREELRALGYLD